MIKNELLISNIFVLSAKNIQTNDMNCYTPHNVNMFH